MELPVEFALHVGSLLYPTIAQYRVLSSGVWLSSTLQDIVEGIRRVGNRDKQNETIWGRDLFLFTASPHLSIVDATINGAHDDVLAFISAHPCLTHIGKTIVKCATSKENLAYRDTLCHLDTLKTICKDMVFW